MAYTFEEAKKLQAYYLPLLKGKMIDVSTESLITEVRIEGSDNKHTVKAIALITQINRELTSSLERVARMYNLASPEEVLTGQGQ